MKILTPLNHIGNLNALLTAGANEFYFGFYDDSWNERFGRRADINRMSAFGRLANTYEFFQIPDIVKRIKDSGAAAYVTLNANTYENVDRLQYIEESYLPELKASGVDGVIVSEMSVVRVARRMGVPVVASTMCGIYNSDIAHAYEFEGVSRMIIPRDVTLEDLTSICCSTQNVEFEVFFMRNGCVFSDAYCLASHERGSLCGMLSHTTSVQTLTRAKSAFMSCVEHSWNDALYNKLFHKEGNGTAACGMCALYRLNQAGVGALKIVGRADSPESVSEDVLLTKRNLAILEDCHNEDEFLKRMEFPKDERTRCLLGLGCYYPEVRFKDGVSNDYHA